MENSKKEIRTEIAEREYDIERLEKAGLTGMAKTIKKLKEKKSKMLIAYENYRYVRPEKFQEFNDRLRKETFKDYTYSRLRFTPLETYGKVPPMNVIELIEQANERGCFDKFEVADIESVTELPDPIVFGVIEGCSDKFFISQWDDDVKIEDILSDVDG